MYCSRLKVEAAPDNAGVPQADEDAVERPLLRAPREAAAPRRRPHAALELTQLLEPHHARLSHNARRQRTEGAQERFVTQRCHREGRISARARLDALLAVLWRTGYPILQVEEEYVAYDSHIGLDSGWLEDQGLWDPAREDTNAIGVRWRAGLPEHVSADRSTDGVAQRGYFDPALKQFANAYQAGDPIFVDPAIGRAWRAARWAAIVRVLGALTPFADQLVLRGSVALRAIFGDIAREPGDLDFVVTPPTLSINSPAAKELLDDVIAAVGADEVSVEDIWTYERAAGKRLLFPFQADGLPRGTIQLDFVFHEPLPLPAEPLRLDGLDVPVLAASPALALAWKLQWLATDRYPQGKDLYDAMLLAEHTDTDPDLVRELIRPELGPLADEFGPETVLSWSMDWANLRDQYPELAQGSGRWPERLALAMTRFWR